MLFNSQVCFAHQNLFIQVNDTSKQIPPPIMDALNMSKFLIEKLFLSKT